MSNYTYEKDPISGVRTVNVSEHLAVEESVITREGLFKGFVYHVPSPKTLNGALQLFGGDEGSLLDALARVLSQMVYARAMSKLRSKVVADQREDETVKAWLERHSDDIESLKLTDPILIGVEDAVNFKPGERELTPSGIIRALGKAQTFATKLLGEGKIADAMQQFTRIQELTAQLTAITDQLRKQSEDAVSAEAA